MTPITLDNECGVPVKGGPPVPPSAPPGLTQVHPLQITVEDHPGFHLVGPTAGGAADYDTPHATHLEQIARHQNWAWRRYKIFTAMKATYQPYKRQDRFAGCGGNLQLWIADDDFRLTCFTCGDRFCEVCQAKKRAELRKKIEEVVSAKGADCRFLTFTMRHNGTPLQDQIKRLRHCLRLLHQRVAWKSTQKGGIDCIECKPAKSGVGWHVHAHCLVDGKWFNSFDLSRLWYAVTGDSTVVDIKQWGTPARMAHYATKYATKPLSEDAIASKDHLYEAINALKGQRLVNCWGTWHGLDKDDEDEKPTLTPIGSIRELVACSMAGDPGARLYLQLACFRWPELERAVPTDAITATAPPDPANLDTPPPPMDPRWNQVEVLPF